MNVFLKFYLKHYIRWYCDNCNAYLNKQSGFMVDTGRWTCAQCGYENDVTSEYVGKGNKLEQQRKLEEEQKEFLRKGMKCSFELPITKSIFESLVLKVSESYNRLTVNICDTTIHGTIRSVSGISFWNFSVDFNDFGIITGNYFALECDNNESKIPATFCEELKKEITQYINRQIN